VSKTKDFSAWLAEATKAIVEEEAHLIRSVVVEAFNRGVDAAAAIKDGEDRAKDTAALKVAA
jgi:hypothetical protein